MEDEGIIVVAVGNPFDGITLHGPFVDFEAANDWGENGPNARGQDWWSLRVYPAESAT